ncbi:MAG: HpcH/HpaI aldolase family protein [Pseudomonadales bacterium]
MKSNELLKRWQANERTLGVWLSLANTHSAETLARLGYDWLCCDLQHGLLDYTDLRAMLPAIAGNGTSTLVRVPWNEPYEIMKVLDLGAEGVIVPLVNTAEEAARAVWACRYPPAGGRSFGPIRAALVGGRGYAAEANNEIACIAMIETQQGLENLDAIAATPGLDGIYIGPSDLALALGLPAQGDTDAAEHAAAVQRILQACRDNQIAAGIHTSSLAYAKRYWDLGFNFINVSSDVGFMTRAALEDLRAVKQSESQAPESTGY